MWQGLEYLLIGGRIADRLKWPSANHDDIAHLLRGKPRYLFRLLAHEIWLRICVEGESPDCVADELVTAAGVA
jgi:hypothetical protein